MIDKVTNYAEALSFIHGRHKFVKFPTLKRMLRLANLLGEPQKQLKFIHVTGTNGKGSVTAYLRDLLVSQGYDVGTFTSPFIEKFNERIAINGQMVSDNTIVSLVQKVLPAVNQVDKEYGENGGGPTEFEVLTAMMLVYFAQSQPDFVIAEVGIGGTYDSTNIIEPLISVITSVGMDHMKVLGNTLAEIAANKAGIIKKERPIVCGALPTEALTVVQERSQAMQAPLYQLGKQFTVTPKKVANYWGETFAYHFSDVTLKKVQLQMIGGYQIENAAVALTTFLVLMQQLSQPIQSHELTKALKHTTWPGRFEKINDEPLIVLDGAHNVPAMQGLKQTLQQKFSGQKVYVLLAVLEDKQFNEMIAELEQVSNLSLYLTDFAGPRQTMKQSELAAQWQTFPQFDHWQEALGEIISQMSADDLLLITGSLYFVSEVRRYFK